MLGHDLDHGTPHHARHIAEVVQHQHHDRQHIMGRQRPLRRDIQGAGPRQHAEPHHEDRHQEHRGGKFGDRGEDDPGEGQPAIHQTAFPHAREHAEDQGQGDDQGEGHAGEDGGIGQPVPHHVVDRRFEQGRIAEIAEILVAARVIEAEIEFGIGQGILNVADQHPGPTPVTQQQRIAEFQLVEQDFLGFLAGVGPQGLAGDVARREFHDAEHQHRRHHHGQGHQKQTVGDKDSHMSRPLVETSLPIIIVG